MLDSINVKTKTIKESAGKHIECKCQQFLLSPHNQKAEAELYGSSFCIFFQIVNLALLIIMVGTKIKDNNDICKELYLAALWPLQVIPQSLEGRENLEAAIASVLVLLRSNIDDMVWYCTVNHSLTLKMYSCRISASSH